MPLKCVAIRHLRTGLATPCLAALTAVMLPPLGCQEFGNPFRDQLYGQPPVTTASAEGVRAAAPKLPALRKRSTVVLTVNAEQAEVTYGPLYFEDPHEMVPHGDRPFAWTGDDYWNILYGPSRFMVNIALFPVSAVISPPWQMVESRVEATRGAATSGDSTTATDDVAWVPQEPGGFESRDKVEKSN